MGGFLATFLKKKIDAARGVVPPPPDALDIVPLGARLGGMLAVPEVPFLLAGDALSVEAPKGGLLGEHGVVRVGGALVHMLHAGEDALLWLGFKDGADVSTAGAVDECKLFRKAARIRPTTPEEWNDWLDEDSGHLGAPILSAPNGLDYARVWAPGTSRAEPFAFTEPYVRSDGFRGRRSHSAMLYARDAEGATGTIAEYILVLATDQDGEDDFIDVLVGIDAQAGMIQA